MNGACSATLDEAILQSLPRSVQPNAGVVRGDSQLLGRDKYRNALQVDFEKKIGVPRLEGWDQVIDAGADGSFQIGRIQRLARFGLLCLAFDRSAFHSTSA